MADNKPESQKLREVYMREGCELNLGEYGSHAHLSAEHPSTTNLQANKPKKLEIYLDKSGTLIFKFQKRDGSVSEHRTHASNARNYVVES